MIFYIPIMDCLYKIKRFFVFLCCFSLFQGGTSFAQGITELCEGIDNELYADEYRACLRTEIARNSSGDVDCVECLYSNVEKDNHWDTVVDALSAVAAPLAVVGSNS